MSADVYAEDGYYAVVPEWVLDADISAQAVRLYAVLRRYADHRSMLAHPSRRTLAGRMHLSDVKTVDRALADLQRIQAVEVFERSNDEGQQTSNGYRIKRQPQEMPQAYPSEGMGGSPSEGIPGIPPEGDEPQPGNHSQLNHTPAPKGAGEYTPEFEEFWQHYPRKIEKADAFKAWRTALKRTDAQTLIRAVRGYRFDSNPKYIKHASTWLNKRAWEDVPAAAETPAAGGAPRPMYDVAKLPAPGELWTDAQVDMVLGPDTIPLDPPAGLDETAIPRWRHNESLKRRALRRQEAQQLTGWRYQA